MLSIGAVRSSMAAASYFAKDNYYSHHEEGPSQWFGSAADQLGLAGEVNAQRFKELLEGRINEAIQLGRGGGQQHLHGWDLTFSAPKSVSLAALVGGDERLIAAHDSAVKETLAWLQEHALVTRTRSNGEIVEQATGHMLAAVFRHDLSRAAEPQLHSHAVVMNATVTDSNKWQSVHSIRLYVNAKEAGQRYQQSLAMRAAELAYAIVPNRNGTFELDGVPREVALMFSSRAKAVERRLAEQGLTRATATLEQREDAALRTRSTKPAIDRIAQRTQDRIAARDAGLDLERFVNQARQRTTELDHTRQTTRDREMAVEPAVRVVREAALTLSERDAAFTGRALAQRARFMSLGLARPHQIDRAIAYLAERGELVERQVRAIDPAEKRPTLQPGWTTAALIQTERRMLSLERSGRGAVHRLMHRLDAQALIGHARAIAETQGFSWTNGQAEAAKGVLTTSSRVIAIQGYAGTAKTTTVLATVAEAARQLGYDVKGMAPTVDATQTLSRAIGGEAVTLQRQVAELTHSSASNGQPATHAAKQFWVVDEASLIGARSLGILLTGAELQEARVLLVGDEKQLGSVEAGRAFAQLQEAGMPTFRLTEIVRQTNEATKEAVYAALRADASRALRAIERGGGDVVEIKGRTYEEGEEQRRAFLAQRYAELTPSDRAKTVLADPSREGRAKLNEQVRETLRARGELQGTSLTTDVLVPKGLTPGEQKHPVFYQRGDIISFRRDLAPNNQDPLLKDTYYTVVGIDAHGGRVQLQHADGSFAIWRPGSYGAREAEVYRKEQRELATGDKITWTKNLPAIGIANSSTATITSVQPRLNQFTFEQHGKRITLDTGSAEARHLDYGYAQTAHKLQGQTAERALIHAEDWRLNLTNQRSFYVLISRAKDGVIIATSDRAGLVAAIRERSGEQQAALDELESRQAPTVAQSAMQQTMQDQERERTREQEARQQRDQSHVRDRDLGRDGAARSRPGGRDVDLDRTAKPGGRARDRDDDLSY